MSVAIRDATTGSTPNCCSPMSASPESLRRIRLYTGSGRAGSDGIGEIIAVFASYSGFGIQAPGSRPEVRSPKPEASHEQRRSGACFGALSNSEANEPRHVDVLAGLGARLRDHLRHGHGAVANRRLLEQHELRVEAPELALDDLVEHVGGLAGALHLGAVDRLLLVDRLARHVLAAHPFRVGRGDLHRDLLHEI